MKMIMLASALLLFSSCIHTPQVHRPFSPEVRLEKIPNSKPISMEEINSGNDLSHRNAAKKLGISYVDYLHMVNNGKVKVIKSEPVIYHKHQ